MRGRGAAARAQAALRQAVRADGARCPESCGATARSSSAGAGAARRALPRRSCCWRRTGRSGSQPGVAPGQRTLGFMLPYTPLHHLLLDGHRAAARDDQRQPLRRAAVHRQRRGARAGSRGIADYLLLHDRAIVNRVDDSVVRVMDGAPRLLRRARGYAPAPLALPAGFAARRRCWRSGGELKSTFCLLQDGAGDAVAAHRRSGGRRDLRRLPAQSGAVSRSCCSTAPEAVAVDLHPEYLSSSKLGRQMAAAGDRGAASPCPYRRLPRRERRAARRAAGARHRARRAGLRRRRHAVGRRVPARRLSRLRAARASATGADAGRRAGDPRAVAQRLCAALRGDRLAAIQRAHAAARAVCGPAAAGRSRRSMRCCAKALNCPPSSSCGRLFDAVAAALGICRERADLRRAGRDRARGAGRHALGCRTPATRSASRARMAHRPRSRAVVAGAARRSRARRAALRSSRRASIAGLAQRDRRRWRERCRDEATGLRARSRCRAAVPEPHSARASRAPACGRGLDVLSHRRVPANDGGLVARPGGGRRRAAAGSKRSEPCVSAFPARSSRSTMPSNMLRHRRRRRRAARDQLICIVDERPPDRRLRRRLGAGPRRLRHEPDRRGRGRARRSRMLTELGEVAAGTRSDAGAAL